MSKSLAGSVLFLFIVEPMKDLPAQTEGAQVIEVGETLSDVLELDDPVLAGRGPSKRFELAVEHVPVTIFLESYDFDAFLRVEDSGGNVLAQDDDGGVETNARVMLAAVEEGACWVIAASKKGGGELALSVAAGDVPCPVGLALLEDAIEYRAKAAERALERGDRRAAAEHRLEQGNRNVSCSRLLAAKDAFESSAALSREIGDLEGEGFAVEGLGIVFFRFGEYAEARTCHERDLAIEREQGDRAGEASALLNLGNIDYLLGDFPRALERYERARALWQERGMRAGVALADGNLGNVHHSLGDFERARECFEKRLAFARESRDPAGETYALGNLGNVFYSLGDFERARAHYAQRLELARETGDRIEEAAALGSLGVVDLALERPSSALAFAREAAALAEELGMNDLEVRVLSSLALAQLRLGELDGAGLAIQQAERSLDLLSASGLAHGEAGGLRSHFAELGATTQDLTAARARRATDAGDGARAIATGFADAGRWKSRSLLAGIAEHRRGGRSAESIRMRRAQRELSARHGAVLEELSQAVRDDRPVSEIELLRDEADAILDEVEHITARFQELAPRDAALDQPTGVSAEVARRALIDARTALVEYVEGEKRLYAYVLDSKDLAFLDLGERAQISSELDAFLSGFRGVEPLAGADEIYRTGKALFERLLLPALDRIEEPIERLLVVPCASLAALPFDALVVEGEREGEARTCAELAFVLDCFEVTYGPSVPVLVELASTGRRASAGKALVLADPLYATEVLASRTTTSSWDAGSTRALPDPLVLSGLPGTRREALAIAALLLGNGDGADEALLDPRPVCRSASLSNERFDLYLGAEASHARLGGGLREYAVLHLAAHGFVNVEFPRLSGIALSFEEGDQGYFTIGDALELDLDADLVVLSACDTAKGKALAGEGIESLARAFLYSGARAVVASLWQVADQAAAEMMESFYRGVFEEGLSRSRALRKAKLDLRRARVVVELPRGVTSLAPKTAHTSDHPYFWAPFIHIGLAR